jgi:hypothetical protein
MPYQITANTNAFVMGSADVAFSTSVILSSDIASTTLFQSLGGARGIKISESWENVEVKIDNSATHVVGIKNQEVAIEAELLEFDLVHFYQIRGGLDTGSTSYTSTYTEMTFKSGGNMTINPVSVRLQHCKDATSSQYVRVLVHYGKVSEGLSFPFPADDADDAMQIPLKIRGTCLSSLTAGQQLYAIQDTRSSVYTSSS